MGERTAEDILGPAACEAAEAIAASAPPFTPQQRDDLAVLLRDPIAPGRDRVA